ncbi:MAG TPA: hypothetical protein VN541_13910, partial [Tepidisphaeraceae bacterium]|nr:hypothetical protein [Tepidisphaeraceae bacterium]
MISGPANADPLISYGTSDDATETGQDASVTFDMAGSYTFQVTVTNGTATRTADVSVTVNQTASDIDIEPGPVELLPNATQQFSATVLDQFANPMSSQPQITWSTGSGGGSVDQTGMFTAPSQLGSYSVSVSGDGVSSQSTVLVSGGLYQVTITGRIYESSGYIGTDSGGLTVTDSGWISAASPLDAVTKAVSGSDTPIYGTTPLNFPADYPSQEGFAIVGLPASPTTQQSAGQIEMWDGDLNAKGDYDYYWNVTVDAQPLPPKIKSLKFGGNGAQSVTRDHGQKAGMKYDSLPQWLDGNLNGVVDGTPNAGGVIDAPTEHQYPLSYVRSTPNTPDTISITANFAAPLQQGEQIEGVTNYNGIVFGPITVNAAGATSVSLTASKPLPGTIDSAGLQITWEYSLNGGNFQTIEQTTNHLYVTGAAAPHVLETELFIACNAAQGMTPRNPGQGEPAASNADNSVINAIFAKFKALSITRADGTPLTYYADYTDLVSEVVHLLKTGDGECGSWTELLMGALTAGGIPTGTMQHAKLDTSNAKLGLAPSVVAGFFVNTWTF